jgi:hypothetical protein
MHYPLIAKQCNINYENTTKMIILFPKDTHSIINGLKEQISCREYDNKILHLWCLKSLEKGFTNKFIQTAER